MFFFFKQKTAYEMRISDWSSDVCSSDLTPSAPWPWHCAIAGEGTAFTRTARRSNAQEHSDDRPHRLRQDRDQPSACEAGRSAVRQGRGRSEESRVGKECVSTCSTRG